MLSIRKINPRMSDVDILKLAEKENRIVVTMDKDFGELAIDAVLKEGILKEVPVLATAHSIYNVGHNVSNYFFTKKLILHFQFLVLCSAFRRGRIDLFWLGPKSALG